MSPIDLERRKILDTSIQHLASSIQYRASSIYDTFIVDSGFRHDGAAA